MVAKAIGNRGAFFKGGPGGIGSQTRQDGNISWTGIVGQTGDVIVLSASDLNSNDKLQRGYSFQSTGGATVDFTLVNVARAKDKNPEVRDACPWANTLTVAGDGTIVFCTFAFAAARITFTGPGEVYVVAH